MSTLAIILPIEFFCRVDETLFISKNSDIVSNLEVKLQKGIWLKSSPISGYPAPVDHSSFARKKRHFPSDQQNGLHYTWIGSTFETKCLVSFNPSIPETSIAYTNQIQLRALCTNIAHERVEISDIYRAKKMKIEPRIWKAFRMTPGDSRKIDVRQWLYIGELTNLLYGSSYGYSTLIMTKRMNLIKQIALKNCMCTTFESQYIVESRFFTQLAFILKSIGEELI